VAREGARLQDRIRKSLEKMEDIENKMPQSPVAKEKLKTRITLWVLSAGTFASFSLSGLAHLSPQSGDWRPQKGGKPGSRLPGQPAVPGLLLSLAEERERRRLAVYLHDQIGHTLALANIRLGELQKSSQASVQDSPPRNWKKLAASWSRLSWTPIH